MRLTACLFKKIMPGGHLFTGKHRLQFKPDAKQRDVLRSQLMIEEKNMLLLRNPFLTVKQSRGHSQELGLQEQFYARKWKTPKPWWESVRVEDKLNHLRYEERWE